MYEEEMLIDEVEAIEQEETIEGEPARGEEVATEEETQPRMYTEEEFNQRVEEVARQREARMARKVRREVEAEYEPYMELGHVVKAGLATEDIGQAAETLGKFYKEKGVVIPERVMRANPEDTKILAMHEAQQIIGYGLDEVSSEVDRLAAKGAANMTDREKIIFSELANYRKSESGRQSLLKIGASKETIESEGFKTFASQFNANTPIEKVYEIYQKTTGQPKPTKTPGSMKTASTKEPKSFYTPEEVDKLTRKDFENPQIMEAVRNSMPKWK